MNQLDTLIHMANQIADNNSHYGTQQEAAERVAAHLKKFWARSMKQQIIGYLQDDGSNLTPLARIAIEQMMTTLRPEPADLAG
ncbi:formate dehydrogenase subunit delta [Marinobacterium rhizophilum]|uniref:Formate dehydrogenase subunit delta n=1 Tax=Marinobacterium rhizophilum TaxID=420402 RepID=A0ABY5HMH5_9GAMM|nr:formate dehydrogenase subunit delta [Marinobacterium rhizophilum]UTW13154.1 formate dehydrogenase subunit delta [Marinobacterium rhizophilum]